MASVRHPLRPAPPPPDDGCGDEVAVLVVCLAAGLVPWLGLALRRHWSGAELGAALPFLGVGLAQALSLLAARHRSRR